MGGAGVGAAHRVVRRVGDEFGQHSPFMSPTGMQPPGSPNTVKPPRPAATSSRLIGAVPALSQTM
jgi:hypothetical protein